MSLRVSSQTTSEFARKQSLDEDREPRSKSKYLSLAIIGIFLSLAVYGAVYLFLDKPYVAVYLTTGDVYFGKLSHTLGFRISDPWFIEKGQNGDFALRKFADAIWKPSNVLDISSDQVVFWNKLPSDSPVIAAMEGKGTPAQNGTTQQGAVNQVPTTETQPTTQNQKKVSAPVAEPKN